MVALDFIGGEGLEEEGERRVLRRKKQSTTYTCLFGQVFVALVEAGHVGLEGSVGRRHHLAGRRKCSRAKKGQSQGRGRGWEVCV